LEPALAVEGENGQLDGKSEIVPSRHCNPASSDSSEGEEDKGDDDLLKNHPYDIKYLHNDKTNRKLKRMVCMFEN
jgi:hypothetical protein